ncbi:MAG: hypothetical protein HN530_01885 [Gammaproteobacteria bacterium]|nr:hypothetical protein [Gammaproteobacteria bacterium]
MRRVLASRFCFGSCGLVIELKITERPAGAIWPQLNRVGILCGIGFIRSLFVRSLAFDPAGSWPWLATGLVFCCAQWPW